MTAVLELLPGLRRAGATNGGEWCGPCPWCAGRDRFRLWPEHASGRARWWCRRCGRHGDEIDLRRELTGASFREAAGAAGRPVGDRPRPARRPQEAPLRPPCAAWQSRAESVAVEAERALWASCGARALAYLRQRGFCDETVRGARLGYMVQDRREAPETWGLPADHRQVWVPRGITIPWRACGATWRLNVRRPAGEQKYAQPAGGSGAALFGVDGLRLRPDLPAVLVEGEFDALAVAQTASDLVAAVATGSTHGARHPRWLRQLAAAPVVLVAYDDDDAGEQAAAWWLDRLPRARRLVPEGDPAAMLQSGADLRAWVGEALS